MDDHASKSPSLGIFGVGMILSALILILVMALDESRAQELQALRSQGDYEEALTWAEAKYVELSDEHGADSWESVYAEAAVECLESILDLDDESRRQVQDSDRRLLEGTITFEDVATYERLVGNHSVDLANALESLARVQRQNGLYEAAIDSLSRALDIHQRTSARSNLRTAVTLTHLAQSHLSMDQPAQGLAQAEDALAIRESLEGADSLQHLRLFDLLAKCCVRLQRLQDAMGFAERAMKTAEENASPDQEEFVTAKALLGFVFQNRRNHAQALQLYEEALQALERLYPHGHLKIAVLLNDMARCSYELGRVDQAQIYSRRAVAIDEQFLARDGGVVRHPLLAVHLGCLGVYCRFGGELEEAVQCFERALEIAEGLLGPEHGDVVSLKNNLASTLLVQGEFGKSLVLQREALASAERRYSVDHPSLAACLSNVALCLVEVGRPAEALPFAQRALEMQERLKGDRREIATSCANLANCLAHLGRHEESLPMHERAVELFLREGARGEALTLKALSSWASSLTLLGRSKEAMALHERAVALAETQTSLDPVALLGLRTALAQSLEKRGRLREALEVHTRNLSMRGESIDRDHPDWVHTLCGQARALEGTGRFAEAHRVYEDAYALTRGQETAYPHMAATLWGLFLSRRGQLKEAEPLLFEAIELLEGRRREAPESSVARSVYYERLRHCDPYKALIRCLLAQRRFGEAFEILERGRGLSLLDLLRQDRIEKRTPVGPMTAAEIASCLREDEALIAYDLSPVDAVAVLIRSGGEGESPHIEAFSLTDSLGGPISETVLEPMVDKVLSGLSTPFGPSEGASLLSLKAAVLPGEIEEALVGMTRVFVVPDGPLHRVPLEPLLSRKSSAIAPSFVYGVSGTVLMTKRRAATGRPHGKTLVALGGAEFDASSKLPALPGSIHEVRTIAILCQNLGGDVVVLEGEAATSNRLYESSDNPRFLHLATHGILGGRAGHEAYLALSRGPKESTQGGLRLKDLVDDWGNRLSRTELVVLSACQSSRGALVQGEGFIALTWGFLYAGARSVVATLWPIEDSVTAVFMERFYQNLLGRYEGKRSVGSESFSGGDPMPRDVALAETKRWLSSLDSKDAAQAVRALRGGLSKKDRPVSTRELPKLNHPYYWAGFVLIGSPD